jgi:2-dehydropantoate 2-reductase
MENVMIYGAGAIGSFVGYLLSEVAEDECALIENVAFLGRKSHIQTIIKAGLRIDLQEGHKCLRFRHCFSSPGELHSSNFFPDIVLVCVKTYSLKRALDEIIASGALNGNLKNADFILLMNGMGNREVFKLTSHNVFEGVTSIGANFPEDGSIELKGRGKTVFEDRIGPEIKHFMKKMFEENGFEIEFANDFKNHQWNKLFVNSVINPITALTRKHNGIVLSEYLEDAVEKIVEECVSVAAKDGCIANKDTVLDLVHSIASKTSMNTSSMQQDVLRGRMTEIDSINGYVISQARKHDIKVPANETVYALVKSMENTTFRLRELLPEAPNPCPSCRP